MDADGAHPRMALRHVLIVRNEVNQRSSGRRSSLLCIPAAAAAAAAHFSSIFTEIPQVNLFYVESQGRGERVSGKLYQVSLGAFCCFEARRLAKHK